MKSFVRGLLFSTTGRSLPAERWLNIALRTLHLIAVAGVGAAFLYDLPQARTSPFNELLLVSGVLLALIYIWTHPGWLATLSGQSIILKVLILLLATVFPSWQAPLFIVLITISAVIAHAPGRVRAYRLFQAGEKLT